MLSDSPFFYAKDTMNNDIQKIEVFESIMGIDIKERRVVSLMLLAGYKKKEIAETLNIHISTVYYHVRLLRQYYEKEGF